jgi:ABC-type transport system substrate-binding protein
VAAPDHDPRRPDRVRPPGRHGGHQGRADLATSLPAPTNSGKTCKFDIRKGIKFSNGQALKPSDFVTTFERQFTVPGPTTFYSGIVGASKCTAKACNPNTQAVLVRNPYFKV